MPKFVYVLILAFGVTGCTPFQSYNELAPYRNYIVQPNDNIHSIAFSFEITPGQLRRANPWLNPLHIAPGMNLQIPRDPGDGVYVEENHDTQIASTTNYQGSPLSYIWPLKLLDVSSRYGRRHGRLHAGIDLRAPPGTPILAAADGRVKFSGYNRDYGHMIVIDHGNGIETAYAHNSRNTVGEGQTVKQGQIVARVGRTGNATGNHVHFEFRRHGRALNPANHVDKSL